MDFFKVDDEVEDREMRKIGSNLLNAQVALLAISMCTCLIGFIAGGISIAAVRNETGATGAGLAGVAIVWRGFVSAVLSAIVPCILILIAKKKVIEESDKTFNLCLMVTELGCGACRCCLIITSIATLFAAFKTSGTGGGILHVLSVLFALCQALACLFGGYSAFKAHQALNDDKVFCGPFEGKTRGMKFRQNRPQPTETRDINFQAPMVQSPQPSMAYASPNQYADPMRSVEVPMQPMYAPQPMQYVQVPMQQQQQQQQYTVVPQYPMAPQPAGQQMVYQQPMYPRYQ